jgi:4-aminobutyrate aminotransferase-like enzyme
VFGFDNKAAQVSAARYGGVAKPARSRLVRMTNLIAPTDVHATIDAHPIGDAVSVVFDLQKRHGPWVVDATTGIEYVDFYGFFASLPLGFHPSAFQAPANRERLYSAAIHKLANSDVDTRELADFVRTFAREAMPPAFQQLFLIEGGALAVENSLKAAFDWKAKKNRAAGRSAGDAKILHFRQDFYGRTSYTMSLTNTQPIKVADNVFTVSSQINSTGGGSLTDRVRCQIILEVMQEEALARTRLASARTYSSGSAS